MEKTKDQILEQFAKMSVDSLDKLRDSKTIDLRDTLSKLYKAKDDLLCTKHEKRKELILEGNTLSKTEQLLKGDDVLFKMKRIVLGLTEVKNKLNLELELIKSFFWKARV